MAALQLAAGLTTLPFAVLQLDPNSNHAGEAVLAGGWLLLAAFTGVAGPKLRSWAMDVSLILSSTLLAAGSAISIHASVQILNGIGIGIGLLGVLAAYTLSRRRIVIFLAFSVAAYLASVVATPLIEELWIAAVLIAMLVFNTAHVWFLVNRVQEASLTDPLTGAIDRNGLCSESAGWRLPRCSGHARCSGRSRPQRRRDDSRRHRLSAFDS